MDKVGAKIESARDYEVCECGRRRRVEECACRWQLVLGIDFTASNCSPCATSRDCQGLHDLKREAANPYLQALSVVAMLSVCGNDKDRCQRPILTYGFGDARTTSRAVFAFSDGERALGPVEVAARYRAIAQAAQPGGPSSLAPLIRQTISKRRESSERHAVLVLLSGDLSWSAQQATKKAAAEALEHGVSIAVLGVGDGPFDRIERLSRESPCIRFAKFRDVAAHFPFGRLEAAQEIHRMLTAPTVPIGMGQAEVPAGAASYPTQPEPLCPPDAFLREREAVPDSARFGGEKRLVRTVKHAAAALSASLMLGAALSAASGGARSAAMTFCLVSLAACLLRKRRRMSASIR